MARLILLLMASLLLAGGSAEARRVALVIGNGAYRNAGELPNPPNDAKAVAASLKGIGFEVYSGADLGHEAMRDLMRKFAGSLDGADTGLVFYAGHGLQVEGENYLLPIDAQLGSKNDLVYEAFAVSQLVAQLEAPDRASVLILDACRNNPLSRSFQKKARALVGEGLARVNAGTGSLIAFATAPGDVALDGAGDHSPFTTALLRYIATPGLEINQLMTRVRADVYASTNQDQLPWTNSALLGELYLVPGDGQPPPTVVAPPVTPPVTPAKRVTSAPAVNSTPRVSAPAVVERKEPSAFTMVACTPAAGSAWAGERFLTYQQCKQIGGDWRLLQ